MLTLFFAGGYQLGINKEQVNKVILNGELCSYKKVGDTLEVYPRLHNPYYDIPPIYEVDQQDEILQTINDILPYLYSANLTIDASNNGTAHFTFVGTFTNPNK
jgi:hypothetical protein